MPPKSKSRSVSRAKASTGTTPAAARAKAVPKNDAAALPEGTTEAGDAQPLRRVTRNSTGALRQLSIKEAAAKLAIATSATPAGKKASPTNGGAASGSRSSGKQPQASENDSGENDVARALDDDGEGVAVLKAVQNFDAAAGLSVDDPFAPPAAARKSTNVSPPADGDAAVVEVLAPGADDGAPATGGDQPKKAHRAEGPRRPRKKGADEESALTRLKTLTPVEKKAASALRDVLLLLANEAAMRSNRIPQLCVDAERLLQQMLADTAAIEAKQLQKQQQKESEAAAAAEATDNNAAVASQGAPAVVVEVDAAPAPAPAAEPVAPAAATAATADGGDDVAVVKTVEAVPDGDEPTDAKQTDVTGDEKPDVVEVVDPDLARAIPLNPANPDGPKYIPLPPVDLQAVVSRIKHVLTVARERFDNNVDDCQMDLDDFLTIRPIAHAVAAGLNEIEGFVPPPAFEYPAKSREQRQKMIDSMKAKRTKAEERERAKQAEVVAKAEDRQRKVQQKENEKREAAERARQQGTEDMLLAQPREVEGVVYAPLPLHSPDLFFRALQIWAFLVSVPKAVKFTQLPFSLFLLGLQDDSEKATMMRDVVRGLIEAAGGADIVTGRGGKTWLPNAMEHFSTSLDELIEAEVAAASGKKLTVAERRRLAKQRREAAKKKKEEAAARRRNQDSDSSDVEYSSDDDDDDEDDDVDDDDEEEDEEEMESGDDDEAAADGAEADGKQEEGTDQPAKKKRLETPAQRVRRQALEAQAPLRELHANYSDPKYCVWSNLTVADRIIFVEFLVQRALESRRVLSEADAIEERSRVEIKKAEAKAKGVRDDANREIKEFMKNVRAAQAAARAERKAGRKRAKDDADGEMASPDGGSPTTAVPSKPPSDSEADSDDDTAQLLKNKKGAKKGAAPAQAAAATGGGRGKKIDYGALTDEEIDAKKAAITAKADKAITAIYLRLRDRWEADDSGVRIRPIGEDRYRRLVWYLPQDRRLLVYTASGYTQMPDAKSGIVKRNEVWGTPSIQTPAAAPANLVDDEEEEDDSLMARRARAAAAAAKTAEAHSYDVQASTTVADAESLGLSDKEIESFKLQSTWGYVPLDGLDSFMGSLNALGRREGPLRQAVESLRPQIEKQDAALESLRAGRRQQQDFGYVNRQRGASSGWAW